MRIPCPRLALPRLVPAACPLSENPRRPSGTALRLVALLLAIAVWAPMALAQDELGAARLQIAGSRLVVGPQAQTVPFDTPTLVTTELQGFDPALGSLPPDLRLVGDFSGPEIDGVLTLQTFPNEPFRIPRLRLKGEYVLDNIRLMQGEDLLAFADPRAVTVTVTQILVTRVSSRALTQDEIRNYGLVINDDSFQGLNLTFGFGVFGQTVEYNMPLIYDLYGQQVSNVPLENTPLPMYGGTVPPRGRFQPPQLIPFSIQLEDRRDEVPQGGCDPNQRECRARRPPSPPLVGVILFPTDISLLHQYFSVVLMVQNGAPDGDPLVVRDLFARILLPGGLRQSSTEPPTPLGVPVPVRVPGADGQLGTADDLHFIVAQMEGEAEFLLEGLTEGNHIVEFEMEGILEGLPTGVQRITGKARGAVVVRDPSLSVSISHPDTVRNDELYKLYMTVTNLGTNPVNGLTLQLPISQLSGVSVEDDGDGSTQDNLRTIDQLLHNESATVEFDLRSRRTGRVVASSVKTGSSIDPSFEFQVGVANGVPLSPISLSLPRSVDHLPPELVRKSLSLLGLGHSLSTAPPSLLDPDVPRVGKEVVNERIYRLAQAGRHVGLGEDLFDALAILASEWAGARDQDWDWDQLQRQNPKGAEIAALVGESLMLAEPNAQDAFERFSRSSHFLGSQLVLAQGPGVELEVRSRTSGKVAAVSAGGWQRQLPFSEIFPLDEAELALLAVPEEDGYQVTVRRPSGGAASLRLLLPEDDGDLRVLSWNTVPLTAEGSATVQMVASAGTFALEIDDDGDGLADHPPLMAGVSELAPRPFQVLGAVQNASVDPSGHVLDVLFSEDVEISDLVPRRASHFQILGKVSNGGLIPAEADVVESQLAGGTVHENPLAGLLNTRVVRVVFDNPLSPFADHTLEVDDLSAASGQSLAQDTIVVQTTVSTAAGIVEGMVIGPDGQPVPGAEVRLYESDLSGVYPNTICAEHVTAAVLADAQGRFTFDYVRNRGECGDLFRLVALDPQRPFRGKANGRVRFLEGETQSLDVLMLGRGRLRGSVRYDDGTVPDPATLEVVVYNPLADEGRLAHIGDGSDYDAAQIPVGTLTVAANDGQGNFLYNTLEMPVSGALVEHDLVIVRRAPGEQVLAQVRGNVVDSDGVTPVVDAYVVLYVDGVRIGVERSAQDGGFDFGIVPAGLAEIDAFSSTSRQLGDQVTFDLLRDETRQVTMHLRTSLATIEGTVYRRQTNGSVTPVAGAVVWLEGLPFNTLADQDGHYLLEGVFEGDWRVRAADIPNNVVVAAPITVTAGDQPVYRDLYFDAELPEGGIVGQVVGYDGQPVAGARVHLSGDYYSVRWSHEALTDADGQFAIADISPGTYGVHAVSANDGGLAFARVRFPGDTATVQVRFQQGAIRGQTVVEQADGSVVGVASLVVYRTTQVVTEWDLVALAPQFTTVETDANGHFAFEEVLVGPYEIYVYNALAGNRVIKGELFTGGQEDYHEIQFEEQGGIAGTVYDYDGVTPVEGATLQLSGPAIAEYDLTTGADGRFHFELLKKGTYTLTTHYENGSLFRKQWTQARLEKAGQEIDIDIVLQEQGSVEGQVVVDLGAEEPEWVPGAVVTLSERAYPWRTLTQNADAEGRFSFENIFLGEFTVRAQALALGGLGGKVNGRIYGEGEEVAVLLQLQDVGEIVGRVISPEDGSVVSSARLALYRTAFFDSATTDSEGEARFRLLPTASSYQLRAFDPRTGRHGASAYVRLDEANGVLEVEVVLEARGTVKGHLYDPPSNVGIPGNIVKLRSQGLAWFTTYATTDQGGEFIFGGIPEGHFQLEARGPSRRRFARNAGDLLAEDEIVVVDLSLEQTGGVFGRVLNPPGMEEGLFPDVNVVLRQGGYTLGGGFDNPFSFDSVLQRLRYTLEAKERGGAHRALLHDQLDEQGEQQEVDLRMQAIGRATIAVYDSAGQPVPGADIYLHNLHPLAFNGSTFNGSSGNDHLLTFGDVREGRLWARATDPRTGLRGSTADQLSFEGQDVLMEVHLQNSGTIRGTVTLSDGSTAAAQARVALIPSNGKYYLDDADELGHFELSSIPMGDFTLAVQDPYGPGTFEHRGRLSSNLEILDLDLVLDDEDPYVVSFDPPVGSRDLPVSTGFDVTFSEPVDHSSLGTGTSCGDWFELRPLSSFARRIHCYWAADDRSVHIVPDSTLASATGYLLVAKRRVRDVAGRSLAWDARTTFYTADVIAPTVVDILPRNGQNQVSVASVIDVAFSEPIDPTSFADNGTFILRDLLDDVQVAVGPPLVRTGDRRVIWTPVGDLSNDRLLEVTVQGVRDRAGVPMAAPVVTTFWTPDVTAPEITWLSPADGTTVTAGDTLLVEAEITDNRGLQENVFRLGEWSLRQTAAPFTWQVPAPIVGTAGPVTLSAEATDIFGNLQTSSLQLTVEPLINGVPPQVTAACPAAGDFVAPGLQIPVTAKVSDDSAVESYWLLVDGVEVGRVTPVNLAETLATIPWTPPAEAMPGQTFSLEYVVRDFAANVSRQTYNVQVPSGSIRQGDGSLPSSLSGDVYLATGLYDGNQVNATSLTLMHGAEVVLPAGGLVSLGPGVGADLVLQCGSRLDVETIEAQRLAVESGAELRPAEGGHLRIDAADEVIVEAGAVVDGRGRGYAGGWINDRPGGAPAGVSRSEIESGGSHGGLGSAHHAHRLPGAIYDSVYRPQLAGGGGAAGGATHPPYGGNGGGIVEIFTTRLLLDGRLQADGEGANAGAGAGGGVWLQAETLEGIGSIDVRGGTGAFGGGGGGRVGLWVESLLGFDPIGQTILGGGDHYADPQGVTAPPTSHAGAGTLFLRTADSTYGSLWVDNSLPQDDGEDILSRRGPETVLPLLGGGGVVNLQPQGADAWLTLSAVPANVWLGAWTDLLDPDDQMLGAFRVAEIDAAGRLRLEAAAGVSGAVTARGTYRFDAVTLSYGASLGAEDPLHAGHLAFAGETVGSRELQAESVRLLSGARVRPASGGELSWAVSGTLTIEAGASLDVDDSGYLGGAKNQEAEAPPLARHSDKEAGGSHGGRGSTYLPSPWRSGEAYDSLFYPGRKGGGGGAERTLNPRRGGGGGGVVHLQVGELVLDGEILAQGVDTNSAGGAGGTIFIAGDRLAGSGKLRVNGGQGPMGGGGGGRIALWVDDLSSFDLTTQVEAKGGRQHCDTDCSTPAFGGSGTIFTFDASSTHGSLRLDQGGAAGERVEVTPIPALGDGTIGNLSLDPVDASHLWMELADPNRHFVIGPEGLWCQVRGVDYRVIGQSADRRRLLLEGAANALANGELAVGDAFSGLIKLDQVTVVGGAYARFTDRDQTGVLQVDGESIVERLDQRPPLISSLTPAEGTVWVSGQGILLRAEITDESTITEVAFSLGEHRVVVPQAPYEVTVPAVFVDQVSDILLSVEATDELGFRASLSHSLEIHPLADTMVPTVSLSECPAPFDLVGRGVDTQIPFSAVDDQGLESYALRLDGVEVWRKFFSGGASLEGAVTWRPAEDAVPGLRQLILEVRDFAGNVDSQTLSLDLVGHSALGGGGNLDSSWQGVSLLLAAGDYSAEVPLQLASLVLQPGAVLTSPEGLSLDLEVSGEVALQCGSRIDLQAKGYAGGTSGHRAGWAPPGAAQSAQNAAGSHGGRGNGSGNGRFYDSVYQPIYGGGGGGWYSTSVREGGAGGGVLQLQADEVRLEGEILARGQGYDLPAFSKGATAGGGGGVNLRARVLRGSGVIDASGGRNVRTICSGTSSHPPRVGGGGRVAIVVEQLDGFDPLQQVKALSGGFGCMVGPLGQSSGTVWVHGPDSVYGDLIIATDFYADGDPVPTAATGLPVLGTGEVGTLVPEGDLGDAWMTSADPTQSFDLGVTGMWVRIDGTDYRVLDQSVDLRQLLLAGGDDPALIGRPFAGVYKFDALIEIGAAEMSSDDIVEIGAPLPQLQVDDLSLMEGEAAAHFSVGLDRAAMQDIHVTFQTVDGDALAGQDYVATSGSLVLTAGATQGEIVVPLIDDALDEPDETFTLLLSEPSGALVVDDAAVATIVDDDLPPPLPQLSVADITVAENDGTAHFTVQLNASSDDAVAFSYRTVDGSALAGEDYQAVTASASLPAGSLSLGLSVGLLDDELVEAEETFSLQIYAAVGADLGDDLAEATVQDDDGPTLFVEGAAAAGLDQGGDKRGGMVLCDVDQDGDLDAVVNLDVNQPDGRSRLLHNDGGVFTDVTASHISGFSRLNLHRSVLCADIDGDGDVDLARNGLQRIEIYRNGGPTATPPYSFGHFTVEEGPQSPDQVIEQVDGGLFAEGMAWLDADLDGDLDLVVENDTSGLLLLSNDGSGLLALAEGSALGLPTSAPGHGDFVAVADFDVDGDIDILARRSGADLFRSQGDGSFVADTVFDQPTDEINKGSVLFCDLDADGDLDVFWSDPGVAQIWRNDAGDLVATGEPSASAAVSLGTDIDAIACEDVDNDGDLDLFLGAGSGPGQLFLNDTPAAGVLSFHQDNLGLDIDGDAEAAVFGDIDLDGDLDLAVSVHGAANQLWLNPTNDAGDDDYLVVRALECLGDGQYRDALGATLRLWDDVSGFPLSPLRQVSGGSGHGGQGPAWIHFGIERDLADLRLEVTFLGIGGVPSTQVQRLVPETLTGYRMLVVTSCGGINLAPSARPRTYGYAPGQDLDLVLRGDDPEGVPLRFEIVDGPLLGSLSGEAPSVVYTPGSGPGLRDHFTFRSHDGESPSAAARIDLEPPLAGFVESAASSGLAVGQAKEGGLALCDLDDDGDLDLLLQVDWNDPTGRTRMLRNDGGVFTDVTASHAAGLSRLNLSRSVICADIDNDGDVDLARNGRDRIELYRNNGPSSTPPFSFGKTDGDGPQGPDQAFDALPQGLFAEGMGWLDVDLDGDLDLVVENDTSGIALLLNDGGGTLAVVDSASHGLPTSSADNGDYLTVADWDADGDVDLAARRAGPDLFRGLGDGGFLVDAAFDQPSNTFDKGAIALCDFDSDGDLDLFWSDAGVNRIWRNDGQSFVATGEPAASAGVSLEGGIDDATCADVDLDGDIDLFLATDGGGGLLFLNANPAFAADGRLQFRLDNGGIDLAAHGGTADSSSAAFGDIDLDGDEDLLVQMDGAANQLWLNSQLDGGDGEYLAVRLLRCVGAGAYRDDLGATLQLFDADGTSALSPLREINGGRGHGSQDAAWIHFGLPEADASYRLRVRFLGTAGTAGPVVDHLLTAADLATQRRIEIRDVEVCP